MTQKPSATFSGTVETIIKPPVLSEPEKAHIAVKGEDHLYQEIRIANTLTDDHGEEVSLTPGAKVQLTIRSKAAPPRTEV